MRRYHVKEKHSCLMELANVQADHICCGTFFKGSRTFSFCVVLNGITFPLSGGLWPGGC